MVKTRPSNLEDHLGYHLRCLSNFVSLSFADKVEAEGVSVSQWVVMRVLYDGHDMTLNETAEAVGVDNSSLSRMVERLVQKRLVDRRDGKDRRSVSLALTSKGNKLVPRLAKLADENDEQFFGSLTTKQKEDLLRTVRHLLTANGWNVFTRGKDRLA
jgi:DNA-binding MarR family transcriptional regulator